MKLTRQSSLRTVALAVGEALRENGIDAVLTGGACAAIHSDGAYFSTDLDFVVRGRAKQEKLDAALGNLGFRRVGAQYINPDLRFFVEFPAGPLGIGGDLQVQIAEVKSEAGTLRLPVADRFVS